MEPQVKIPASTWIGVLTVGILLWVAIWWFFGWTPFVLVVLFWIGVASYFLGRIVNDYIHRNDK